MAKVFISHSATDTWVAKQIASNISAKGVPTFLDEADIDHGDDFEAKIKANAKECSELLVLLTPWSINRPYLWLEIGLFWGDGKRIVAVTHGITPKEVSSDERVPILLKKTDVFSLNEIESYFSQLAKRSTSLENRDG